jgi:hypothetical protein
MKSKGTLRITIGLLVLTAAGSFAYAQTMQMPTTQGTTGCPMMGMMGQDGMPGTTGHGMMGPGSMAAQVEGRLAYLKADLAITEAQAPAWKQFEEAVRSRTSAMHDTRQEMMRAMQTGSISDRRKARIAMMESMVTGMKAQSTAIENLYRLLTDEQKKKSDQLLGMGMM